MQGSDRFWEKGGAEQTTSADRNAPGRDGSGDSVSTLQDRRSVLKTAGALGAGSLVSTAGMVGTAAADDCLLPGTEQDPGSASFEDRHTDSVGDEGFYRPHSNTYSLEHRTDLLLQNVNEAEDANDKNVFNFAIYSYGLGSEDRLDEPNNSYPVIDSSRIDIDMINPAPSENQGPNYNPGDDIGTRPSGSSSGISDTQALKELWTGASAALGLASVSWAPYISAAVAVGIILNDSGVSTSEENLWEWTYFCASEMEHFFRFNIQTDDNFVEFDLQTASDSSLNVEAALDWNVEADLAGNLTVT